MLQGIDREKIFDMLAAGAALIAASTVLIHLAAPVIRAEDVAAPVAIEEVVQTQQATEREFGTVRSDGMVWIGRLWVSCTDIIPLPGSPRGVAYRGEPSTEEAGVWVTLGERALIAGDRCTRAGF